MIINIGIIILSSQNQLIIKKISKMTVSKNNNNSSNNSNVNSQHDDNDNNKLKILLLGDGDFSWSYDFARYLKMKLPLLKGSTSNDNISNNNTNSDNNSNNNNRSTSTSTSNECDTIQENNLITFCNTYNCVELHVTGIDNAIDIEKKYPHSKTFIIPQLLKLNDNNNSNNNNNNDNKNMMTVQVKYNINAIIVAPLLAQHPSSTDRTSTTGSTSTCAERQQLIGSTDSTGSICSTVNSTTTTMNKSTTNEYYYYNIVMFHHPHLGIEDCIVHNQFLHHFFYSVRNYWWSNSSNTSSKSSSNLSSSKSCSSTLNNNNNNNTKLLYITLASGQYERWKCKDVANKYNFLLVQRCQFIAQPSISNIDSTTNFIHYYKHRRHQTGKSFAKRVIGNSETFIYTDSLHPTSEIPLDLPWFVVVPSSNSSTEYANNIVSCPYCQKVFQESRSLKNHILSKHKDTGTSTTCKKNLNTNETSMNRQLDDRIVTVREDSNKRSKIDTSDNKLLSNTNTGTNFVCVQCSSTGHSRLFSTKEGLDDHIKAKHNAIHTNLSPDDKSIDNLNTSTSNTAAPNDCSENNHKITTTTNTEQCEIIRNDIISWKCNICDYTTTTTTDRYLTYTTLLQQEHWQRFIPIKVLDGMTNNNSINNNFICQFCNKVFYQNRARLQHENFCTERNSTSQKSFPKTMKWKPNF